MMTKVFSSLNYSNYSLQPWAYEFSLPQKDVKNFLPRLLLKLFFVKDVFLEVVSLVTVQRYFLVVF